MIKTGNYVHGTAAEKIQYDVYQQNKVLQHKKKQRSYHKVKFKAVLAIMVVFAMGSVVMFRYALLTELSYKMSKTNKTYNDLKKENSKLKVEIDKSMDLQKIKEIAENKLGMQKPDKFQTTHVVVPKSDYTKVSQEYLKEKGSESKLSAILDKIEKVTRLLF